MTKEQAEFWSFIGSVKKFNEKYNRLPVDSRLKDMLAGNKMFVELQKAFTEQMEEDAEIILGYMKERGIENVMTIDIENVKRMCKSLRNMTVVDGVNGEYVSTWENDEYLFEMNNNLMFLAIMIACYQYYDKNNKLPDQSNKEAMMKEVEEVLKERKVSVKVNEELLDEILKYGGVQIGTVNAVIGSFVAQEIIKYCTHQYGCLDNTILFNTITYQTLVGRY